MSQGFFLSPALILTSSLCCKGDSKSLSCRPTYILNRLAFSSLDPSLGFDRSSVWGELPAACGIYGDTLQVCALLGTLQVTEITSGFISFISLSDWSVVRGALM